jgi:hypothetical protein
MCVCKIYEAKIKCLRGFCMSPTVKKSLLHDRSEVVMCGLDGLPLCDFDLQGRKLEPTGDLALRRPVITTVQSCFESQAQNLLCHVSKSGTNLS